MRVITLNANKEYDIDEVGRVSVKKISGKTVVSYTHNSVPKLYIYKGAVEDILYAEVLNLTLPVFKETSVEKLNESNVAFEEATRLCCSVPTFYSTDTFYRVLLSVGFSKSDIDMWYQYPTVDHNLDYDLLVRTLKTYVEKNPVNFKELRTLVFNNVDPAKDYGDDTFKEAIAAILSNDEAKFNELNVSAFDVYYKIMGI